MTIPHRANDEERYVKCHVGRVKFSGHPWQTLFITGSRLPNFTPERGANIQHSALNLRTSRAPISSWLNKQNETASSVLNTRRHLKRATIKPRPRPREPRLRWSRSDYHARFHWRRRLPSAPVLRRRKRNLAEVKAANQRGTLLDAEAADRGAGSASCDPAIYQQREAAMGGGLMSYGTSPDDAYHQACIEYRPLPQG